MFLEDVTKVSNLNASTTVLISTRNTQCHLRKNLNWQLLKAIEALSNAIVLRSEQTGAIPRTASHLMHPWNTLY